MIRDIQLDTPNLNDGYYITKCVIHCINGKSSVVSDLVADTSITYYEDPTKNGNFEDQVPIFDECYHCGNAIDLKRYT